jgi:hypothetical protein
MVSFFANAITESCRQGIAVLRGFQFIQDFYLAAISSRGTRRDFVDIYCLRSIVSLEELFKLVPQKYRDRPQFLAVAVRALTYFEDAEQQPMPKMTNQVVWEDVRTYCEDAALKYTRRQSGLR